MATIAERRSIALNTGAEMPALGFGVNLIAPERTAAAVATAIGAGYRLIDTAPAYGNEREVGEGIRRAGVERSELFITAKLWIADYHYAPALRAFDASLARLGLSYVDLYLLHWPMPRDFDATLGAYRAAEVLLASGRARAIGVANFGADHLGRLVDRVDVVPAVNQVELHPWLRQRSARDAGARHGVITQSWSPIGGVFIYNAADPNRIRTPIEEPPVLALAAKYGKTPAQVVLRWHLQHGLAVVAKSVRPDRIAANIDIFDFDLGAEDLAAIDAMDTGRRGGPSPAEFDLELLAQLSGRA